jgi:cytochrome c553
MTRDSGRTIVGLAALAIALGATSLASADGSVEAGRAKSLTCSACHGADGNSVNPDWPSLAGQHPLYAERQLQAYKDGSRSNVLMTGMALGLSDEDIADLSAYYAAQKPAALTADPALVSRGARIYRGGVAESGVSACIACHGPSAHGNPLAGYPNIAGQHASYIVMTLKEYAGDQRKTDAHLNQMMRNVSAQLREEEMQAVASYIQGLR